MGNNVLGTAVLEIGQFENLALSKKFKRLLVCVRIQGLAVEKQKQSLKCQDLTRNMKQASLRTFKISGSSKSLMTTRAPT